MDVHPVADLFPMLPDDELADLAADIKTNGLLQPLVVKDGVLIDGRNRLAACETAGVEPVFIELNGSDPVAYILSANLARRHMTKGQRAMAGVRAYDGIIKQDDAAEVVGVDQAYVSRASQVLDADPDLADQVLAGTIALNEAYGTIQERRRETKRLTEQRQRLRELAPDLDDQVAEGVIALTEALQQAQEQERVEKEKRRDAVDLLDRVLTLVAPDHVDEEFLNAWADRIGIVSVKTKQKTRQAGEALLALAERLVT